MICDTGLYNNKLMSLTPVFSSIIGIIDFPGSEILPSWWLDYLAGSNLTMFNHLSCTDLWGHVVLVFPVYLYVCLSIVSSIHILLYFPPPV